MNPDSILPPDFDGVFRFTNFTDEDFSARWDNVEYTYPALKTTPMIIPGATPEQVQHIRKKFAKELALREFYKTEKFKNLNSTSPGGVPAIYAEQDLAPLIQRCLEPLPLAQAAIKQIPRMDETKLRKDSKGRNVTRVLDKDESLLDKGSGTIEA